MMWSAWVNFVALAVFPLLVNSQKEMPGVVKLTDGTFDKILSRFKYTLVKFDKLFPDWTQSQMAFQDVARATVNNPDFLLADVNAHDPEYEKKTRKPMCEREKDPKIMRLRGYGPRQNLELAERFNFKMTSYPALRLFIQGQDKPEVYEWDTTNPDHIKLFLFKKTGLWLCPSACLRAYDKLAEDFFSAENEEGKKNAITKAEKQSKEKETHYRDSEKQIRRRARYYTKIFKNILTQGESFLGETLKTVTKALDGEIKKKRRDVLEERLNIVKQLLLIKDRVSK